MSKPKLEPVNDQAAAALVRPTTERIELPTGGRSDIDGLLRELARVAFHRGLVGFAIELDRTGFRCFATVRTHKDFGAEQVAEGEQAILRALLVLGIIKPAQPAAPPAAEDGAQSPPTPPQSPSTSAE